MIFLPNVTCGASSSKRWRAPHSSLSEIFGSAPGGTSFVLHHTPARIGRRTICHANCFSIGMK